MTLRANRSSTGPQRSPPATESRARMTDWSLFKRMVRSLGPQRKLVLAGLLLLPIGTGSALVQPLLIKRAIEAVLGEQSVQKLAWVAGWFALVIFLEFVGRFGETYFLQLAGQRTVAALRRQVFAHLQKLPLAYFDRTPVGRVVTRLTNDVDTLSEFFSSGAVTAMTDLVTLVGILAFMLYLDVQLTLVAMCAVPPLALLVALIRRRARSAFSDIRTRIAQLNAFLNEQVQGLAVVQAFGREKALADRYRQINDGYRGAHYRAIRYDAILYSVVEAISAAAVAAVLWYAAVELSDMPTEAASAAYVGTVAAFYDYVRRFFVPIRDLSTKYTIIQSSLASSERIFALLDVPAEVDSDAEPTEESSHQPPATMVEFDRVTFGYRSEHPVLHEVSFRVARGDRIALVGATGAGKTTVGALLLRLYDGFDGTIRIAGRDARRIPRESLRAMVGVVPQDVFLFYGTIAQNVALGREPDRERVLDVLSQVGLSQLVQRRGGLDARVEERGNNFSAGERQLLAFARALYREADILLLDEATANIDSETESLVQRATQQALRGRTALVIAHRLSTIRHCDRILVFHHGRLVEQGSHEELLRSGSLYPKLHALHFGLEAENGAAAVRAG